MELPGQARSLVELSGRYLVKTMVLIGGTILLAARASERAMCLAILVLPAYHALNELYVKKWAIQSLAKVSSKVFYKGGDLNEFERRGYEYAKVRYELAKTAVSKRAVVSDDLLKLLGALRCSIFFEESYRTEYEVLWIACLEGKQELEHQALHDLCKSFGISTNELERVLGAKKEGIIQIKDMVKKLCAKMC